MIRRLPFLLAVAALLLLTTSAVRASDPIGAAALARIHQIRVAAGGNPTVATDFGFRSAEEMDKAQVLAVYPVRTLSAAAWTGDTPDALPLEDTPTSWVVVGIDNDPRVVVTVLSESSSQPRAVEVGIVPAAQLSQAMAATNGAGQAVYVPGYVSIVVLGRPGSATVRPLLTELAARNTGMKQGSTMDERHFIELARAFAAADVQPLPSPNSCPAPADAPAGGGSTSQPFPVIVGGFALVGVAVLLAIARSLLVSRRR